MTITFRDDEVNSSGPNVVIVVDNPTGTVQGDLMVALFVTDNATATHTGPSGWTEFAVHSDTDAFKQSGWFLVAGPSEPANYIWTASVSSNIKAGIATFFDTGGVTSNWILQDEAFFFATTNTLVSPSITCVDSSLWYGGWGNDGPRTVSTPPATATLIHTSSVNVLALSSYFELRDAGAFTQSLTWNTTDETGCSAACFTPEFAVIVEPLPQLSYRKVGRTNLHV